MWFECAVVDALLSFEDPTTGKTLDHKRIDTKVDLFPPHCAEVDIVIKPSGLEKNEISYFLFLKTSLRERWKQWERDASAAKLVPSKINPLVSNYKAIGLFYEEKRGNSDDQDQKIATNIFKKCMWLSSLYTIKVRSAMLALFKEIVNV